MMTFYKTISDSRDSRNPMGKAREIHVQIASGDNVIVTTWRHTSAMPLAIGQKIEVWDCVARHSNFHHSMVLHVNNEFELVIS